MNAYFSNIVNNLEKNSEKSAVKPNMVFSTLKILEYWVRILQANPECINFEIAIRLMDEKQNLSFVDEVVNYFKRFLKKQKHKAPEEESLDFLFNEENKRRTDVC